MHKRKKEILSYTVSKPQEGEDSCDWGHPRGSAGLTAGCEARSDRGKGRQASGNRARARACSAEGPRGACGRWMSLRHLKPRRDTGRLTHWDPRHTPDPLCPAFLSRRMRVMQDLSRQEWSRTSWTHIALLRMCLLHWVEWTLSNVSCHSQPCLRKERGSEVGTVGLEAACTHGH